MENFLLGATDVFNLTSLMFMFLGVFCGVIVGAIPGLSGPMAIALCIPLTYYMSTVGAVGFLVGINKGGTFGGSIASILLNTPGSPESAATCYDGYPLALQGKGEKALKISLYSSAIGDTISAFSLVLLSVPLASVALKMAPADLCAIIVFSLVLVAGLDTASMSKGLIAGALGMLLACVGMDPVSGQPRLDFGSLELTAGIPLMCLAIGTLAMSEIIFQMQKAFLNAKSGAELSRGASKADRSVTWAEFRGVIKTAVRSSGIGVVIGVLPGLGATMAAFMAYGTAKKASKKPEEFGKGSLEGIAAPEAANNAIIGANLVPLLTLGIPGNVAAAIILGAFIIHGLAPGPMMFAENPRLIYGVYVAVFMAGFMNLFVGSMGLKLFIRIMGVPRTLLYPAVLYICIVGAYLVSGSVFAVGCMLALALLGFFMRKFGYSFVTFLIGFVLEPAFELSLQQTLILSGDNVSVFFTRPVPLVMLVASLLLAVHTWRQSRKARALQAAQAQQAEDTPLALD